MSYSVGTITGSATPGASLRTVLKAALDAHPAWAYVEDYTTGAFQWSVYKCKGTSNLWGSDFYIAFTVSSVSTFWLTVFEGYNPATHGAIRPAPYAGYVSRNVPIAADGSFGGGAESVLPQGIGSSGFTPASVGVSTSAANGTFDYWIVVTNNGVSVSTRVGATPYAMQVGLFDSLVPNDPAPLAMYVLSDSSSGGNQPVCIATRNLTGKGTTAPFAFGLLGPFGNLNLTAWNYGVCYGNITAVPTITDAFQGAPLASRIAVVTSGGSYNNNGATYGVYRGLLRDVLFTGVGSGLAQGDTLNIAGHTYVCVYISTVAVWIDTQAV